MNQDFPSLVDDEYLTEESFWPSFTDVLTVIVMIFMMAMLVLLLRNMDLVSRLQDTISQKEQVFQQSELIKKSNTLMTNQLQQEKLKTTRLHDRQQQLMMQLEQDVLLQQELKARSQLQQSRLVIAQQQQQAQSIQLQTQQEEIDQQRAIQTRLESRYELGRQALQRQTDDAARKQSKIDALVLQHQELQHQHAIQQGDSQRTTQVLRDQLQKWRVQADQSSLQLIQLNDVYSSLSERYIRLLRPARSATNKHVVEVLYNSSQGQRITGLRNKGAARWREMPRAALEQHLSQLKQQYGNTLYVRIIIPDDSDISFNEAWRFTHEILSRYDYYYQR